MSVNPTGRKGPYASDSLPRMAMISIGRQPSKNVFAPALSKAIQKLTGREQIFFFDAVAPIINQESINLDIVFQGSRYGSNREEGT